MNKLAVAVNRLVDRQDGKPRVTKLARAVKGLMSKTAEDRYLKLTPKEIEDARAKYYKDEEERKKLQETVIAEGKKTQQTFAEQKAEAKRKAIEEADAGRARAEEIVQASYTPEQRAAAARKKILLEIAKQREDQAFTPAPPDRDRSQRTSGEIARDKEEYTAEGKQLSEPTPEQKEEQSYSPPTPDRDRSQRTTAEITKEKEEYEAEDKQLSDDANMDEKQTKERRQMGSNFATGVGALGGAGLGGALGYSLSGPENQFRNTALGTIGGGIAGGVGGHYLDKYLNA